MFVLYADKNRLTVREAETLTSGSVNACRVRFEFSPDWEGLERRAVFSGSGKQVAVLLDESGECAVPWETLTGYGGLLMAGVSGAAGERTLPTVRAVLGTIRRGADPGPDQWPPTPELWRQELERKGDRLDCTEDGGLGLFAGDRLLSAVSVGHGLKVADGQLTVDTASDFTGDNTLPMTAAGVETVVGNIEVLLQTI